VTSAHSRPRSELEDCHFKIIVESNARKCAPVDVAHLHVLVGMSYSWLLVIELFFVGFLTLVEA
jgi:hypothetical protein